LKVDYTTGSPVVLATETDSFTNYGTSQAGNYQPTGWTEYGGDWFVHKDFKHLTLWNPAFGGDQSRPPPFEAGTYKRFEINGKYQTGDQLDVTAFGAATLTDPQSWVMMRVIFSDGTTWDSPRLGGRSYDTLRIEPQRIPTNASYVLVAVVAVLGPTETSSVYVDDVRMRLCCVHASRCERHAPTGHPKWSSVRNSHWQMPARSSSRTKCCVTQQRTLTPQHHST
jgi:hypothetical protein